MKLRDKDDIVREKRVQAVVGAALRWLCGLILLAFASAPAWLLANMIIDVIHRPGDFSIFGLVAAAIAALVLGFLLLLAYRAFTGRGRVSDGGLLSPWLMYGFLAVLSLIGISGFIVAPHGPGFNGVWGGALILMFTAIVFEVFRSAHGFRPSWFMFGVHVLFFLFGLGMCAWGFNRAGLLGLPLGAAFLFYGVFAIPLWNLLRRRTLPGPSTVQ